MLTITIDGYVATGKGTTAVGLARKLGYIYLDTGAMYRAVARYAREHNLLDSDEQTKAQMLSQITLSFHHNLETDHDDIYLNGHNIEKEIRQTTLTSVMKPIVISPVVRQTLGKRQYKFGQKGSIVVDGRDMGTVVFSDAHLKLFLVGDRQIRTERRYQEMIARGVVTTREEILSDIITRDNTDYLGPDAVNHKAPDAIEIDTSRLTVDEQIDQAYQLALKKIKKMKN